MNRLILAALVTATMLAGGCGTGSVDSSGAEATAAGSAPEVGSRHEAPNGRTVKPQGPVTIGYNIIGTPIVGQPVGVNLQVKSTLGTPDITLSYRVNDTTALQLPETQPPRVAMAAISDGGPTLQQVQVIPLREGRLFLNVTATVETEDGSYSTATAIPIQVGAAPRPVQENGEVLTDENGELIRSLPAKEQ